MKTIDLEDCLLDYWVAKAQGHHIDGINGGNVVVGVSPNRHIFLPSTNWAHGGKIIDKCRISIIYNGEINEDIRNLMQSPNMRSWTAFIGRGAKFYGDTALIAAMICYVHSIFGCEVDEISDEIIK